MKCQVFDSQLSEKVKKNGVLSRIFVIEVQVKDIFFNYHIYCLHTFFSSD